MTDCNCEEFLTISEFRKLEFIIIIFSICIIILNILFCAFNTIELNRIKKHFEEIEEVVVDNSVVINV